MSNKSKELVVNNSYPEEKKSAPLESYLEKYHSSFSKYQAKYEGEIKPKLEAKVKAREKINSLNSKSVPKQSLLNDMQDKERVELLKDKINSAYVKSLKSFISNESRISLAYSILYDNSFFKLEKRCCSNDKENFNLLFNNISSYSSYNTDITDSTENSNDNDKNTEKLSFTEKLLSKGITKNFFSDVEFHKNYTKQILKHREGLLNKTNTEMIRKIYEGQNLDTVVACIDDSLVQEKKFLKSYNERYEGNLKLYESCFNIISKNDFHDNSDSQILTVFNKCLLLWNNEHNKYSKHYWKNVHEITRNTKLDLI